MVTEAAQVVIDPWPDVHERHKVRIYAAGIGGVTGLMPESVSAAFSNSYSTPFGQFFHSLNTGVVAAQELANRSGQADFSAVFKELTSQVWGGGSPIVFPLQLLYIARNDPLTEVLRPVQRVLSLSAGTVSDRVSKEILGRVLTVTNVKPPPHVQVELGYFMRFSSALVKSCTINVANRTTKDGTPFSVKVNLQIETSKMYINEDSEFAVGLERWAAR